MTIHKFTIADAAFERSPGQDGDIFTGNLLDQRHGGPVTVGFGRYGPDQILEETMAVHDTMVILEGKITVSNGHKTVTAGPGEIIAMQKGDRVTIRSHENGAVTAYVTYPHWQHGGSVGLSRGQDSIFTCDHRNHPMIYSNLLRAAVKAAYFVRLRRSLAMNSHGEKRVQTFTQASTMPSRATSISSTRIASFID